MKIKKGLIYRRYYDEGVIIDLKRSKIYILNEVGAKVFEGIKKGLNENDISNRLKNEFDVPSKRARDDMRVFIKSMVKKGLFVVER